MSLYGLRLPEKYRTLNSVEDRLKINPSYEKVADFVVVDGGVAWTVVRPAHADVCASIGVFLVDTCPCSVA